MTTTTPVLQVRDLRVDIGERTVLQSVSLDVQPGSLVVLMGAYGWGWWQQRAVRLSLSQAETKLNEGKPAEADALAVWETRITR